MWAEQKLPLLLDSGVNVKQDQFVSTRSSEKQKNPHIDDCAFDYLGLIWRRVAAVRP